jgi:hypothetical protein
MPLPVSSFPNIACTAVEDKTGRSIISVPLLLRIGSLMSILNFFVIETIGLAAALIIDI